MLTKKICISKSKDSSEPKIFYTRLKTPEYKETMNLLQPLLIFTWMNKVTATLENFDKNFDLEKQTKTVNSKELQYCDFIARLLLDTISGYLNECKSRRGNSISRTVIVEQC